MIADDLFENLLRHRLYIMDAAKYSNRILFVDTDAITTLFYARFLLTHPYEVSNLENMAISIHQMTHWDLVLFLEPDVAFVQDGTRSEVIQSERLKYSRQIKQLLEENKVTYHEICGDYLQRFEKAKRLIADELGITTVFEVWGKRL